MSLIASKVLSFLNEIFPKNPHKRVYEEYFVKYKGQNLFFDFFVKELGILVECQGEQHFNFVKHFHGNTDGFNKQKLRDNLKIEYVQQGELYLIHINYYEEVSKELILSKMNKVLDSETRICF